MNALAIMAQSLVARPSARFDVSQGRSGPKPKIAMGTRFGRWTVLGFVPGRRSEGKQIKPRYTCRCECGTVRDVLGDGLARGLSQSCGCLTGRSRIPAGMSS